MEFGLNQSSHGPPESALILVVERDPHIRQLERYFLEEAGFGVEFSADGAEALERARARQPDILVTEILVPGMDGLQVCRALKAEPDTRGIAVLVFSILAAEARALAAGADAFLLKPLDDTLLIDSVQRLIGTRQARREAGG